MSNYLLTIKIFQYVLATLALIASIYGFDEDLP